MNVLTTIDPLAAKKNRIESAYQSCLAEPVRSPFIEHPNRQFHKAFLANNNWPIFYSTKERLVDNFLEKIVSSENQNLVSEIDGVVFQNFLDVLRLLPDYLVKHVDVDDITITLHGTIVVDWNISNDLVSIEIGKRQIGFFTQFETKENILEKGEAFDGKKIPHSLEKVFSAFIR